MSRGLAAVELALDRVTRHHRHVHQQAQRDDERGDRDLLQVDAERRRHAERERQRERDAERQQHRRAPLPEPHERHQHYQDDRLPQAAHQQVDVLLHLQRLVGGAGQDQVGRQPVAHHGQRRVHRVPEVADLLPRPHLERERDRPPLVPLPGGVRPAVLVQVPRRVLVFPVHVHQVPQVERHAGARAADDDAADLARVAELPARLQRDRPVAHLHLPAAERGVARLQDVAQPAEGDAVRGQALLGEAERHLLVQHAQPVHLGHLRDRLEGALELVGVLLQLLVAVLVPRHRQEARPGRSRVAHDRRLPGVGVELGGPKPPLDEAVQVGEDRRVGEIADPVHPDELRALEQPGVAQDAVLLRLRQVELSRPGHAARGDRGREVVHHRDPVPRRRPRAELLDRGPHLVGAERDLHLLQPGARHREHQRRGAAEVLDELNRPGARGQVPDPVEPEADVVEDLAGLGHPLLELDVDVGDVGPADRPDGLHVLVLRHHGLDPPGDPVLDPLGVHAGPGGDHQRGDHRDVGVLPLGHLEVPDEPPEDRAHERDPGDLALLGEVAGEIAGLRDQRRVVDVRHGSTPSGGFGRLGRRSRSSHPAPPPARPGGAPPARR